MQVARIHLCRHGEVDAAWHGRIYGAQDVPLAPEGRRRFDVLATELAHLPLAAVYASDLVRAVDGARRIAAPHGLSVQQDPRLREIDRGEWVGLTPAQVDERWSDGMQRYLEDPDHYREHGGENHVQLADRAMPALAEIADRHRAQQVLAVCHAQVMRVVVARVLGIGGAASLNLMTGHGGLTTVDRYPDGVWVVQAVNAPTVRAGAWGGRTFKP